jgi:hypothetical protein
MRLKIKNANVVAVPIYPRTFRFAYDDLQKGTVDTNGNPTGTGYSALGHELNSLIPKTPCRVSISAVAYTIDGHRYQPIVRLACNKSFIVGGYNKTGPESCDNVLIPEGATKVGFSVEYAEGNGSSAPYITTEGEDALQDNYQTGDITLTISKP